jgi:uncharacterized NAD-dependent epimerase/dehydratase family protein
MPGVTDSYEALSAMIAPALFLTGTGSLVISTSNRMSRIVDRVRTLNDEYDRLMRGKLDVDMIEERAEHMQGELARLIGRSNRIRVALILLYFSLCSFASTSLLLGLDVVTGHRIIVVPTLVAVAGVGSLLISTGFLLAEALTAMRTYRLDIAFYQELHERRRAARRASVSTQEATGSLTMTHAVSSDGG